MSQPLLVPIHVEAKVLQQNTAVTSATDDPFRNDPIVLGKGVHLHWALPSALMTGRTVKTNNGEAQIFPGVPDLWLVVRFNPPNGQKRDWKGWVVDSTSRIVKELKDFTPLATDAALPAQIHTTPKLLPRADTLFDMPGWGYWTGSEFNPASTTYYPDNMNRFGFYDDLRDLPALQTGKLSYSVIGWYSRRENDPLSMAKERRKLLERWKWRDDSIRFPFANVSTIINNASGNNTLGGKTPAITMQDISPSLSEIYTSKISPSRPEFTFVSNIPDSIICHGSVLSIEPNNATSVRPTLNADHVLLSLNIKRGLTEATKADASKLDVLEALVNDAADSFTTDRDLADLHGLNHALTFQGQAGKGKLYFQLNVIFTLIFPRPLPPTDENLKKFGNALKSHMAAIKAESNELPIQDRLIRISITTLSHQNTTTPQPETIEWIDVEDANALLRLYKLQPPNRTINSLSSNNLYEIPGERWYYPSSPHLILTGAGRNYHIGYETRFDPAGILRCRSAGSTLTSLNIKYKRYTVSSRTGLKIAIPDPPVLAQELINTAINLSQYPFVPSAAQGLLAECMLLDSSNASLLGNIWVKNRSPHANADTQGAIEYFRLTIDSIIFLRKYRPDDKEYQELKGVPDYTGTLPSPIAITPWQPVWIPLMVDTEYTYTPYPLSQWKIGGTLKQQTTTPEEEPLKEPLPADMELINPNNVVKGTPLTFSERNILSSTISSILEDKIHSAKSTDENAHLVPKYSPMKGIEATLNLGTLNIDILSAALVGMDSNLDKQAIRERSGVLKLNKVKVIDVFGETTQLTDLPTKPLPKITLSPRLPYWGRLQFRLNSARQENTDATDTESPVCGYLIPDLIEHSLEVYDDNGIALGQVIGDKPVRREGTFQGEKLKSRFVPLPWIAATNSSTAGNALAVINNRHLRDLVAGIIAQETVIPYPGEKDVYSETVLTAFMRMIETMRLTVDGSNPIGQWKLRFMGEPVAVVRARMWVEATSEKNPHKLKKNPENWKASETLPSIQVKVGDESRPNDGVIGCFIPNSDAIRSRFTCTSNLAISHAFLKDLSRQASGPFQEENVTEAIKHPFFITTSDLHDPVKEDAIFSLKVGDKPVHLTVLQDLHGGICLTSGVLPRKQITMPTAFITQSEEVLRPSVHTGPVMAISQGDELSLIPPISKIGEYSLEWWQPRKATTDNPMLVTQTPIPEVPRVGAVPPQRVVFSSGWLTLNKQKEES